MKISATQKHARMSPRKIRPYARMVQGMSVTEAQGQLSFAVGKAPGLILEVLNSAVANAKHNAQLSVSDLRIASILVNQGLVMKRFMPAAKGMAHAILKRTAHITVIVEGDTKAAPAKKTSAKKAEVIKTVTTDEFVAQQQKAAKKEEAEHEGHEHGEKHGAQEHGIEKANVKQAGAEKKKTHRRKSIG